MLNTYILLIAIINQLTWKDYTGKPDSILISQGFIAHTETRWTLSDMYDSCGIILYTDFEFVPEKSWTITNSESTLAHENTHYLISLLWHNKFQEYLDKYDCISEKQRVKILKVFNHYWVESQKLQTLFDKETNNGQNQIMELKWGEQIRSDLNKFGCCDKIL